MIFLVLSVLASGFFMLTFKYFEKYKIDNFHAAAVNYLVAGITGFIINNDKIHPATLHQEDWFFLALLLGTIYICMINVIALCTQRNGVSVATVATKTSLIIPVVLGFLLYNEEVNIMKIAGIILALVSVFLVAKKDESGGGNKKHYLFPVILFFSSGACDSLIKYAQATHVEPDAFGAFATILFAIAGILGTLVVIYQIIFQGKKFELKSLLGGLILGVINYGTLFFLMKALEINGMESSVVFPLNNMGIVLFSAIAAFILFKEKISKINWIGIGISLAAIALIAFS